MKNLSLKTYCNVYAFYFLMRFNSKYSGRQPDLVVMDTAELFD